MPKKTVVVFCEGKRTEPLYLDGLRKEPAVHDVAAVDLRVDMGGAGRAPLSLVRLAVDARQRALAEEAEIDEFWCVFDVEWPRNHPHLAESVELAEANHIQLAISNPCFELWLVLHFASRSAWLENDAACRLRRRYDKSPDKDLDPTDYMSKRAVAAERAAALEIRHVQNDTRFPHDNPSSGMFRLLRSLEPLG